jgi:hypothetical protein
MIRNRARIPVSLLVAAALGVVPVPVQAKDKPQATSPLCPGQPMTRLELAAPAQASFGPDENARLNPGKLRAMIVVIPAGRIANFTFSAMAPKDENAAILYDAQFQELAERGTDPAKASSLFAIRRRSNQQTRSSWCRRGPSGERDGVSPSSRSTHRQKGPGRFVQRKQRSSQATIGT